jgi:hypothetical protein
MSVEGEFQAGIELGIKKKARHDPAIMIGLLMDMGKGFLRDHAWL